MSYFYIFNMYTDRHLGNNVQGVESIFNNFIFMSSGMWRHQGERVLGRLNSDYPQKIPHAA